MFAPATLDDTMPKSKLQPPIPTLPKTALPADGKSPSKPSASSMATRSQTRASAPSRWLTLEQIREELRLPPKVIFRLIRQHKLVGVVDGTRLNRHNWRILDPSPEYKRALTALESVLKEKSVIDLMQFPIVGPAEFAEIAGITQSGLRNHVRSGKLRPHKMGRYSVYTAQQVRDFLLARERSEPTGRRVRSSAILQWCMQKLQANPVATLSREEVEKDDALEGTLRRIMRQTEPDRSIHLAEFWRRFELIQSAAQLIKKTTPAPTADQTVP